MVNEVENNSSAVSTSSLSSAKSEQRFSLSSISFIFIASAFIILIVAFYLSYNRITIVNRRVVRLTTNLSNKVEQSQNEIFALQKAFGDSQQNLQQARDEIAKQQQKIDELSSSQHENKEAWSVADAQYLTKLANDNLQVGSNVALVIKLLQTADQDISILADPKLLPVRKALAADIAALQNVPAVDTTGLYLQLSALDSQVDKLPLPNNRPVVDQEQNAAGETPRHSWWRKGLQQSWNVMRQIIVVRYNKPGERPFISPDQQQFLYQNMHAVFQQAMAAVVHKQPDIYRASLEQADAWIKQYFLQESPVTQEVLSNLAKLQSVVIRPDLPPITASLQAFQDYMATEHTA